MPTAVAPRYDVAESVKRAARALDLSDTKRLTTALSIVAADAIERNMLIAEQVRQVYSALPSTSVRSRTQADPKKSITDFTLIKRVQGFALDAAAPINPYLLYEAYGEQQLPGVLDLFSLAKVKEMALFVEEKHPNTKPANKSKKASVIEYIIKYVTMPDAN